MTRDVDPHNTSVGEPFRILVDGEQHDAILDDEKGAIYNVDGVLMGAELSDVTILALLEPDWDAENTVTPDDIDPDRIGDDLLYMEYENGIDSAPFIVLGAGRYIGYFTNNDNGLILDNDGLLSNLIDSRGGMGKMSRMMPAIFA